MERLACSMNDDWREVGDTEEAKRVWVTGLFHVVCDLFVRVDLIGWSQRFFLRNDKQEDIGEVLEEIRDKLQALIGAQYNIDLKKEFGPAVVSGDGGSADVEQESKRRRTSGLSGPGVEGGTLAKMRACLVHEGVFCGKRERTSMHKRRPASI
jgi:hypothetical protein